MLRGIKKVLKEYLYSAGCPDYLSDRYFEKKDASDRAELFRLVRTKTDLMDAVKPAARDHWKERIHNVLISEDNAAIPRHELAGKLEGESLIMHNGLKIDPMSYYGHALMKMLIENKGVHEPQEEKVFQEVLGSINGDKPLVMLELGAYWSFYSMWLLSLFPDSRCLMVEPDKKNLYYGKKNFITNGFEGEFIHAGIGKTKVNKANIVSVDQLCADKQIEFLDILHADIQGYELEMLQGSVRMFTENRVGYAFVSTHSNELHEDCRKYLLDYGFAEVASANRDESYSWDGILVMKTSGYKGKETVSISKRKTL